MSPDAKQAASDRLRAANLAMQQRLLRPVSSAPAVSNDPEQKEDTPRMPDPRTACGNSPMEAGSPEFAEDRTQVNSLNNKFLFDSHLNLSLAAASRSQVNFDNLQQVSLRALNNSVDFQAQVNQRARHADDNAYVTRYDLSNPVTTGAGDTLRSAAYTPNRATDTASAGVGVSAEAVAAAVANAVTANLTPVLAVLQQIVASLANTQQPAKA